MYIVDAENKHAMSAIRKIKEQRSPGATIELNAKEFEALQNGVMIIPYEKKEQALAEAGPEGQTA